MTFWPKNTFLGLLIVFTFCARAERHQANSIGSAMLLPRQDKVPLKPKLMSVNEGTYLSLRGNGIPRHSVGKFPGLGCPHSITEQDYYFRIPLSPVANVISVPVRRNQYFGVTINGIPIVSYSEAFYNSHFENDWNYFSLSAAIDFGLDESYGHPGENGNYHYHGPPVGTAELLGWGENDRYPQVGWAADGHPIFSEKGPDGKELRPSYRLKEGPRPAQPVGPGGEHDGAFNADFVFDQEAGDLDECNGKVIQLPGGRKGYAYFITQEYPGVPKCFRGLPHSSFSLK